MVNYPIIYRVLYSGLPRNIAVFNECLQRAFLQPLYHEICGMDNPHHVTVDRDDIIEINEGPQGR